MAIDYAQIGTADSALAYADMFEKQQDPLNPWRYVVKGIMLSVRLPLRARAGSVSRVLSDRLDKPAGTSLLFNGIGIQRPARRGYRRRRPDRGDGAECGDWILPPAEICAPQGPGKTPCA